MARGARLIRTVARAALWSAAALAFLFLFLVALYAAVEPVSTLMLGRLATGRILRTALPFLSATSRRRRSPR